MTLKSFLENIIKVANKKYHSIINLVFYNLQFIKFLIEVNSLKKIFNDEIYINYDF